MAKNEAWVKIGSAIVVAMLSYLIINIVINQMSIFWKVVIICAVALVALVIAFWGGKKQTQPERQTTRTNIGSEIMAKGGVILENVKIDTDHAGEVNIGSNISAEKDVRIQDIQVNSKGKTNG